MFRLFKKKKSTTDSNTDDITSELLEEASQDTIEESLLDVPVQGSELAGEIETQNMPEVLTELKEKPLSVLSNCKEETPKSARTATTGASFNVGKTSANVPLYNTLLSLKGSRHLLENSKASISLSIPICLRLLYFESISVLWPAYPSVQSTKYPSLTSLKLVSTSSKSTGM